MVRSRSVAAVATACLAVNLAGPAASEAAPLAGTSRVSVSTSETQGNDESWAPAMSGTGRYIAFTSTAQNLVAGTTLGSDVFVRDTETGTTRLVSAGASPGNGPSHSPSISTDGRYVGFVSEATNLVTGDTNGRPDGFVKDLTTGAVRRVTLNGSAQIPAGVLDFQLAGNGTVGIFQTEAALRSADRSDGPDIYRRNLATGAVELVSVGLSEPWPGEWIGAGGRAASVSDDGRFVVYRSPNWPASLWLRDTVADTSTDVMAAFDGSDDETDALTISGNGRYVGFITDAWGLPGDETEDDDAYLYDRVTGGYSRITPPGTELVSLWASFISLSANGRVAVIGGAGAATETLDVFAVDRTTGLSVWLTELPADSRFNVRGGASVNATGDQFGFVSGAPLVADDTNGVLDVFRRSMPACTITGTSGDDTLVGTAGNDVICGLGGNDTLAGQAGNDRIAGGPGTDVVDFGDAATGVTASLTAGTSTGQGSDTLTTVEGILGSPFADRLDGDGANNRLEGRGGADSVYGHEGSDRVSGGDAADSLGGGTGSDQVNGGNGVDTAKFDTLIFDGVSVDLVAGTAVSGSDTDLLTSLENVIGTSLADRLRGNAGANRLEGGWGPDTLLGEGGNDQLFGNGDDDDLRGGAGTDRCDGGDHFGADAASGCETVVDVP